MIGGSLEQSQQANKLQPKLLSPLFTWLRWFFIGYIISEALVAMGAALSLYSGSTMFGPGQPYTLGDRLGEIGLLAYVVSFLGVYYLILYFFFSRDEKYS